MQSTVNIESTSLHFNQRAEIYLSQGKIEDAIAACEQALKIKPDFAPALKTLGNALQAQGRIEEARLWYAKAIEVQPNFPEAYANLGSIFATQQKWSEAISHYQRALVLKPNFAGVYRNLAKLFAQVGKATQSQDCWYQAFTLEPEKATPQEHINLGNSLLQQEKIQEAVNCYSRAIKINPNLAQAYQLLADALKQAGNLEQAAPYYRKAIELNAANGKAVTQNVDTLPSAQNIDTLPAAQNIDTLPAAQNVDTLPSATQRVETVKPRSAAPSMNVEDPEAYNILAEGYLAQGKFDRAIASCRRSLQLKPDPAVYKLLGNALQATGKLEDAKNCYIKALELNPNFAEAYANLGSFHASQEQWQLAINAYQKAIAIKPDFAGAYRNFAKLWTQVGKPVEAAECWYKAFNLDPSKATSEEYLSLAKTFLEQGKTDDGIACYRRALELNPTSSWGYHELAEILKNQEKWEEAIPLYRRAIELNPDHSWSHNNLADALIKLERWEEAVPAYLSAIELNPDHSWSHNNLGDALVKLERWEEAVEAYNGANKVKNDFFWSQNNLGDALMKLERWEEAARAYRRAIEINNDHFNSHSNLAEALVKVEDWEGAIAAYQRAIELNSESFWSYNNLGEILVKLEQWEEAIPVYRRALELNPEFAWAHYNLGQALDQVERWDEAIASYRQALKIQPDLPWLPRNLADALRNRAQADLELASDLYLTAIEHNPDDVQLYHKALEIRPNDADLYVGLADALVKYGWLDGAIVFYQMGLQIRPDDRGISGRLEEVLKKKGVNRAVSGSDRSVNLVESSAIQQNAGAAFDYQKLGETLQGEGKVNEAIAAYKKAIEINPNYFGTYHNLGDIYQQKNNLDEAVIFYEKAIKINPSFAWSHHNLGDTFFRQQKLDEAAVAYRKAIELDPNFAWANYNLGRLLNQQDKLYEALSYYQRANELDPNLFPLDLQILREGLLQSQDAYSRWRAKNCPRESDLRQMAGTVELFNYKPLVSVIVPVYNTPEKFLREAIESVLNQVYPYWELCIADDASTQAHVKQVLEEYKAKDERVKVVYRTQNGHISRASNSALEIAKGEFVTLLDHDDLMTPDALYEVVLMLNRHPEADMIYSDEDKLTADERLIGPYFKPEWCPDSFLSRMYTCHLGTYRRSIINEIGGFRVGFEGAQDYDLVLRFTEKSDKIFHIPKVLYHWRMHSGSTASSTDAKPYAYETSMKTLQEAIERRGEPGKVEEVPDYLGHYIVRYKIADYKLVSIIIPTRNLGNVLDKCLESIFTKSVYPNYEVIVIDNGSTELETAQIIAKWTAKESNRFRCYPFDIPFNFSKINNYGVSKAQGDYLLFLNNDTEVITPDWLDAMVEQAQRSSIGAVGVKLLYADNTIQHAGVVLGLGGVAGHIYLGFPANFPGYFSNVVGMNNLSAVTGACLMCRREVFESVGGFDEELAVAYNDVDLCLKMVDQGYQNIYVPHVSLYHYESKSRGYEDTTEKKERLSRESKIIESRWSKFIENDPCYSPHLTRVRQDFGIRVEA
ncbi:glycosyl transferase family 2 [Oscillatoriales cyanobacterium USR001]|nr:glycosyl transferase family 2 [Oscillatoriales cyanobacterium USR001]